MNPVNAFKPQKFLLISVLGLIVFFAALFFNLRPFFSLARDQLMFLEAGKLILNGDIPFRDFFEVNPPTVMYLAALVQWFSGLIGISPVLLNQFIVYLYFGFSIWLSSQNRFSESRRLPVLLFLVFLNQVFLTSTGQRDQLFYIAVANALLFSISKWQHHRFFKFTFIQFPVMVFSAFKPFFILHWINIPTFKLSNHSGRKNFLLGLGFVLLLNLAFINYWIYFFSFLIKYNYSFQVRFSEVSLHNIFYVSFAACYCVIQTPSLRSLNTFRKNILYSLILSVGIYFLQNKHFNYHTVGIEMFLALNLFFMKKSKVRRIWIVGFAFLFALNMGNNFRNAYLSDKTRRFQSISYTLKNILKTHTKPTDFVLPISIETWVDYPLLADLKLINSSRYLHQYNVIYFANQINPSPTVKADEAQYLKELSDSISVNRPVVVYFVNTSYVDFLSGKTLLEYLTQTGIIARLSENYKEMKSENDIFYFVRNDRLK